MFIYISDVHISDRQPISRLDNVFDVGIKKLEFVLDFANKNRYNVICGGDLFHEPRVSYKTLNAVMDLLKKYQVNFFTIFGNHDMVGVNNADEGCALFTLIKSGLVKRLTRLETENFNIVGLDYTKEIPNEYYFNSNDKKNILVIHNALTTEKARYDHIQVKDFKTDANLVLCGHIHQTFHQKVGKTLFISPGPIVRRSIAEKDIKPLFLTIDDKVNIHYIPCNDPEFCITTSKEVTEALDTAIKDTKLEVANIEDYINGSSYDKEVKEFCISKVNKVREEYGN